VYDLETSTIKRPRPELQKKKCRNVTGIENDNNAENVFIELKLRFEDIFLS
jgi:hypothetical protein